MVQVKNVNKETRVCQWMHNLYVPATEEQLKIIHGAK